MRRDRNVMCYLCDSGSVVGESKSISNEEKITCRQHTSDLAILLLIAAATCILSPIYNVHAYSSTAHVSRIHHRGVASKSISNRCRTYHVSSSQLFSTNDDTILERTTASDATMFQEGDQNIIDRANILQVDDTRNSFGNQLSSSTMVSTTNARRMISNRKMTGLPLDTPTADISLSLFQSSPNDQLSKDYNNSPIVKTESTSWKERLIDVSNLASLLCVLDCTLLPFVSIAIPTLSWGVGIITGSAAITSSNPIMTGLSSFMAFLPAISHGIALYFVIPVGSCTTIVNYFFGHKEIRFSLLSMVGVALIYAANGSGVGIQSIDTWLNSMGIVASAHTGHGAHVHDMCGAVVGAATGMMAHTCPEGLAHRMTNTLGCAFLLGGNYASKKYMENKSEVVCAASALAEAWGGDSGGKKYVCPPGCSCESPKVDEELFFQWNMSSRKGMRTRKGRGSRSFNSRRP